jgi:hypothetical protein
MSISRSTTVLKRDGLIAHSPSGPRGQIQIPSRGIGQHPGVGNPLVVSPVGARRTPTSEQSKGLEINLIGGRKMTLLGYLEAVSEAAAIERAVVLCALEYSSKILR